jgi:hypothetical protein
MGDSSKNYIKIAKTVLELYLLMQKEIKVMYWLWNEMAFLKKWHSLTSVMFFRNVIQTRDTVLLILIPVNLK